MSNEEHRAPHIGSPLRSFLLIGAVMALAVTVVTLVVVGRTDKVATEPSLSSPDRTSSATTTTTTANTEDEVTARLREILEIREKAFANRDASLFEDIYASDCSCLEAGRAAIAALEKEKVLWRNRSISIEVQSAKEVNDRLWEVVAVFVSNSFRIETDQGQLVREAPAERIRYRFLLVRGSNSELWRLGNASPVDG